MIIEEDYPIGIRGVKWGAEERKAWLATQSVKRSYQQDVLAKLTQVGAEFELMHYGALAIDKDRYPLYLAKNKSWTDTKPAVLITGGVHGYETSGVHGALRFLLSNASDYLDQFNLVVAPCISPWAYETINRWNPQAVDPNRSFVANSPAPESGLLIEALSSLNTKWLCHIDLHETTDTDNSEFRPALAARDAVEHPFWEIPDGFYLVGDTQNPADEFQGHIINAVEQVTHIAPSDHGGRIIGEETSQHGVINYATKALGLCTGFSDARFNTTTEVYPDSPKVDDENCIQAQVAAVTAGLSFVSRNT